MTLSAQPLANGSGIAQCQIKSGGKSVVNGKCRFTPGGSSGSFSLAAQKGQGALFGSILVVSVSVVGPSVAEVRGLTKAGINSRWGEARPSLRQPGCWVGSDFEVCAQEVSLSSGLKTGDTIPWRNVQALLNSGEIVEVGQTHSLKVTLTFKDGRSVATTEPRIDAVFAAIKSCGRVCGRIPIATE
ncbi:MAG: hypothetical protein NTY38_12265 [Acidobacteria bacterium]|nr:hypothetical protein [Acidobacteriota bacterium]